ncbi:protein phosphatase 1 regulatory inhibitor subunit 16B-like [Dysidea avara]|uniref:protein phosphatase 1 regulatory inhibitor subunit 16B-like n=1 Tax=Dysidea avara TaxID=196820 RepID=UPI00331D77C4
METVLKRKNYSSGLLSAKLKALTSLKNAKAKRRVTFPVNVMLQQAITDGDKEEIKKIITKHGKSVLDLKDPTGMPLLHRAIFEDQFECFELMVNEGADMLAADEEGWNALHVAVSFEDMDAVELLLQYKPELINTRTMDSLRPINVCESNCELCAYLLQAEVSYLKTRSVTHWDSANCKREELELLNIVMRVNPEEDERSTRQVQQSALHLSAAKNYLGLAYYMLENQLVTVDCEDYEHWTALHLAALHSSMDVLVLLIQYGANVEKLTSCYKSPVDLADDELTLEFLRRGSEYIEQAI